MPNNTQVKKRGRRALGNDVRIPLTLSPTLANTLDVLVHLSGRSRVAILRQALIDYIRTTGVALPGEADPEPTSRRTIRTTTKERSNDDH